MPTESAARFAFGNSYAFTILFPMNEAPSPETQYQHLLNLRRAALARQELLHTRIGNVRLVIFLAAAAVTWYTILHPRTFSPWWILLPASAFLGLIVVHSRVLKEKRRLTRAQNYYERGLARLEGWWRGTGDPGYGFVDPHHPYSQDLDIFGTGSLYERICAARTSAGKEKLATWLKYPAHAAEIRDRQAAVAELAPDLPIREDLAVLGEEISSGMDSAALSAWGSAPAVLKPGATRIAAGIVSALTLAAAALWAGTGSRLWFVVMALVEILFMYRMRSATRQVTEAVEQPGRDLLLLSQVLARLEQEAFRTPRLASLREELNLQCQPPSRRIARLNRLIILLDSRRNLLFAPVAAILLWEIQLAYAIEEWRRENGAAIAGWLAAVSELEAFSSLAGYAFENPGDPFPEICQDGPCFVGEALGHPLLDPGKCVRNDVRLDADLRVYIVSGSNMSGKSTLLRSAGTNAVLAFAGAPVRARSLRISPLAVGASIRTLDSLQEGSSRFYAEITRLRKLVDLADGTPPLFFLLDELLHGTNSHDRRIGAEAIIQALVRRGAAGMVTTHDLALAHMSESLAPRAENVHFEDHLENGKIHFDYRLRPGVVRKSNALELMRSIGLEV
jgi:hypothetical protein